MSLSPWQPKTQGHHSCERCVWYDPLQPCGSHKKTLISHLNTVASLTTLFHVRSSSWNHLQFITKSFFVFPRSICHLFLWVVPPPLSQNKEKKTQLKEPVRLCRAEASYISSLQGLQVCLRSLWSLFIFNFLTGFIVFKSDFTFSFVQVPHNSLKTALIF